MAKEYWQGGALHSSNAEMTEYSRPGCAGGGHRPCVAGGRPHGHVSVLCPVHGWQDDGGEVDAGSLKVGVVDVQYGGDLHRAGRVHPVVRIAEHVHCQCRAAIHAADRRGDGRQQLCAACLADGQGVHVGCDAHHLQLPHAIQHAAVHGAAHRSAVNEQPSVVLEHSVVPHLPARVRHVQVALSLAHRQHEQQVDQRRTTQRVGGQHGVCPVVRVALADGRDNRHGVSESAFLVLVLGGGEEREGEEGEQGDEEGDKDEGGGDRGARRGRHDGWMDGWRV